MWVKKTDKKMRPSNLICSIFRKRVLPHFRSLGIRRLTVPNYIELLDRWFLGLFNCERVGRVVRCWFQLARTANMQKMWEICWTNYYIFSISANWLITQWNIFFLKREPQNHSSDDFKYPICGFNIAVDGWPNIWLRAFFSIHKTTATTC